MKAVVIFSLFIAATMANYGGHSYGENPHEGRYHGRRHYFNNFVLARHEKSFLHRIHLECQEESSCELEYIQDPFQNEDYEPLGDYMLCLAKKYGFMGRHGQLKFENLRYKLGMICGEEDPEFYINTCAVPADYPVSTAFGLWKCLDNHGFHFLKECL